MGHIPSIQKYPLPWDKSVHPVSQAWYIVKLQLQQLPRQCCRTIQQQNKSQEHLGSTIASQSVSGNQELFRHYRKNSSRFHEHYTKK